MQPTPRPKRVLLGSVVVLTATGTAGAAFMPALLTYSPLLLLALSPLPRHLVLAAPLTAIVPFVVVVTLRRLLSGAVAYEVGASYGDLGLKWIEARYPRLRRFVRWLERAFERAGAFVVLIAPGVPICALAGASRLPRWQLLIAVTCGQAFWVSLTYWLGDFLSQWTTPVLAWLRENVVGATIACVALVGGYQLFRMLRRKRRTDSAFDELPKV